jgi:hypothetical protein
MTTDVNKSDSIGSQSSAGAAIVVGALALSGLEPSIVSGSKHCAWLFLVASLVVFILAILQKTLTPQDDKYIFTIWMHPKILLNMGYWFLLMGVLYLFLPNKVAFIPLILTLGLFAITRRRLVSKLNFLAKCGTFSEKVSDAHTKILSLIKEGLPIDKKRDEITLDDIKLVDLTSVVDKFREIGEGISELENLAWKSGHKNELNELHDLNMGIIIKLESLKSDSKYREGLFENTLENKEILDLLKKFVKNYFEINKKLIAQEMV